MLLQGKNAVVYGGGGSIGGAAARAFAAEGARVFLAGRTERTLGATATDIRADGGRAEVAVLDAQDPEAVDAHADMVVGEAGGLDISFNAITHGDVQGTPMVEMELEDYLAPVVNGVRSLFLTSRAAARHMKRQGSGVIMIFGGSGDPVRNYSLGGLQTGFEAMESMRRQLSMELGEYGIRVVTMRSGGVPEAISDDFEAKDAIREGIVGATMLGRAATLRDVGDTAAFIASDKARTMTAATVNISAGSLIDHM
ncbi:MAG TPA: SDR family oxidoreductase [Solirubrobacterales bacterium]|nr:SDR family oxidoreductase [Solirubrobacterales bacterium]